MPTHMVQTNRRIANLVSRYNAHYGREACLSSIVRSWLRANNISPEPVRRSSNIHRVTSVTPANDLDERIFSVTSGGLTLKQVEIALESLTDLESRRTRGTVYTPDFIIDYIITQCMKFRLVKSVPKVIDPACGSGGFLLRAVELLSHRFDISIERTINELIYGIDVNEEAIQCASLLIELLCAKNSVLPPQSFASLLQTDTLMHSKEMTLDSFGINSDGFDIVVTNPPYVKLQNLDDSYRQALASNYPEFTMGSFSLAMLFLVAGYRLLSPSGILGYITQNNIYSSLAGEGVRDFLQKHRSLHTIVNFGHKKIFPGASAYTCLVFLDKTPRDHLHFYNCTEPESQLTTSDVGDFHEIEIRTLNKRKWRLAPNHHLRNLKSLESYGTPLGNLADIKVGFATLKDSVFLIEKDRMFPHIESDVTTPAIKISSFTTEEELKRNRLRVIRPYRKAAGKWTPLHQEELKATYPNAYSYLKTHQSDLATRDKGRRAYRQFFEWGRTQCMEAPGPKLLTKTFNRGPNFLLDETDSLFCNGYSVKPHTASDLFASAVDIRVLQRILNSRIMGYYAKLTSFQIEGDYQCFQKNFIEQFCIPEIDRYLARSILCLEGEALEQHISDLFGINYGEVLDIVGQ